MESSKTYLIYCKLLDLKSGREKFSLFPQYQSDKIICIEILKMVDRFLKKGFSNKSSLLHKVIVHITLRVAQNTKIIKNNNDKIYRRKNKT